MKVGMYFLIGSVWELEYSILYNMLGLSKGVIQVFCDILKSMMFFTRRGKLAFRNTVWKRCSFVVVTCVLAQFCIFAFGASLRKLKTTDETVPYCHVNRQ
jgi:hypothetical protein